MKGLKKILREELITHEISNLTEGEIKIVNELINLNEGIGDNLMNKFRSYLKKGAITAGIVLSLLSTDALAQEQKQEILDVAKTELSQEEVSLIKNKISAETGLDFNDSYVQNNFTTVDNDTPFELPNNNDIEALLIKAGIPSKIIDGVYIDYSASSTGGNGGVLISISLKEEGSFRRLDQNDIRNKVHKIIINALSVYRPSGELSFKDNKGNTLPLNLKVLDTDGNMLGNRILQFNS
jgi:hypothetical protein